MLADNKLDANEWTVGRYSIADLHLFRLYWRFATTLKPALGTYPNLERHYQRMMQRPAVQKALEVEGALGFNLSPAGAERGYNAPR